MSFQEMRRVAWNTVCELLNITLDDVVTGTPSSTTFLRGDGSWNAPTVGSIGGLGAGVADFLATPSSENLRTAVTDESGSGALLFQGGDLGTPSAGVATNLTGTAAGLTAGNVTTNANLTGFVKSVGNATSVADILAFAAAN